MLTDPERFCCNGIELLNFATASELKLKMMKKKSSVCYVLVEQAALLDAELSHLDYRKRGIAAEKAFEALLFLDNNKELFPDRAWAVSTPSKEL